MVHWMYPAPLFCLNANYWPKRCTYAYTFLKRLIRKIVWATTTWKKYLSQTGPFRNCPSYVDQWSIWDWITSCNGVLSWSKCVILTRTPRVLANCSNWTAINWAWCTRGAQIVIPLGLPDPIVPKLAVFSSSASFHSCQDWFGDFADCKSWLNTCYFAHVPCSADTYLAFLAMSLRTCKIVSSPLASSRKKTTKVRSHGFLLPLCR